MYGLFIIPSNDLVSGSVSDHTAIKPLSACTIIFVILNDVVYPFLCNRWLYWQLRLKAQYRAMENAEDTCGPATIINSDSRSNEDCDKLVC